MAPVVDEADAEAFKLAFSCARALTAAALLLLEEGVAAGLLAFGFFVLGPQDAVTLAFSPTALATFAFSPSQVTEASAVPDAAIADVEKTTEARIRILMTLMNFFMMGDSFDAVTFRSLKK